MKTSDRVVLKLVVVGVMAPTMLTSSGVSLCGASAAGMVATGDTVGFAAPGPPYDPAQGVILQLTIGYGEPSVTIGEDVWFSSPGILDLSGDPDLPRFLRYAANGLNDPITVTITEGDGLQSEFSFSGWGSEGMLLGHWPDLSPLQVTGAQLKVFDVSIGPSHLGGQAAALVRWEFTGIPEPSTFPMMVITIAAFVSRRKWKMVSG